jgi:hypothetical protein
VTGEPELTRDEVGGIAGPLGLGQVAQDGKADAEHARDKGQDEQDFQQ